MGVQRLQAKKTSLAIVLLASVVIMAAFFIAGHKAGAACTPPSTVLGRVDGSFSIPVAGTYTVWARIKVPDTTNNSLVMDIDGTNCGNVIADNVTTINTWVWVNYRSGSATNIFSTALTAGNHNYTVYFTENGVQLERIIFASDPACIPSGTGDNCVPVPATVPTPTPTPATPPTVTITAPASNVTVSGSSVSLTANATSTTTISKVEFLVDNIIVATDTTSPYEATWDSTSSLNGQHTITAKAYNTTLSATSPATTITVANTTPPVTSFEAESMTLPSNAGQAQADTAASGGQMLFNWGLTGATATATKSVTTPSANRVVIRARGDQCSGAPTMIVKLDGAQILSVDVTATAYADYTAAYNVGAGAHTLEISFPNDAFNSCDRNLILDKVEFKTVVVTAPVPAPTPAPGTPAVRCDFNSDSVVNSRDLAIFLGGYRKRDLAYDLYKDGRINSQDLAIMLGRCR